MPDEPVFMVVPKPMLTEFVFIIDWRVLHSFSIWPLSSALKVRGLIQIVGLIFALAFLAK